MKTRSFARTGRRHPQAGQAMLFTVLGLGVFLIGAMAFAVDLSNLWFNRQSAQTAADAACTAGAMDLLVGATNGAMPATAHFTAGTAFDCKTASPTPAPCSYAALNGFDSSINQANGNAGIIGNNVYVDFPGSVPGVTTPPSTIAPTPFMRVVITNNIPTFFAGMLRGLSQQSVRGLSICGVTQATAPIPILVLDPGTPASNPN